MMHGLLFVLTARDLFPRLVRKGGRAVEIGVFRGEFSQYLLQVLEPNELFLVDQWSLAWREYNPFPDTPAYLEKLSNEIRNYVGSENVDEGLADAYRQGWERLKGREGGGNDKG